MGRVFILGSGFSATAGLPTSAEVLKNIFTPDTGTENLSDLQNWLARNLFPHEPDWLMKKNIGEILSRLDLIRLYKPLHNADYATIDRYEKKLIKLFLSTLNKNKIGPLPKPYLTFASTLSGRDTVINFNYDLVLESSLAQIGRQFNYLLPGQTNPEEISLLKLHGSVNLFYCHSCQQVYAEDHKSQKCTHSLDPLIVAPTFFKSYHIPILRTWWYEALIALAQATEVTFIGYSLQKNDILSHQLFDYGYRMNPRVKIAIVNGPNADITAHQKIYGDNINNTRSKFSQFVADLCL